MLSCAVHPGMRYLNMKAMMWTFSLGYLLEGFNLRHCIRAPHKSASLWEKNQVRHVERERDTLKSIKTSGIVLPDMAHFTTSEVVEDGSDNHIALGLPAP